ncbi:peptidoglycan DD-metalloendopeptidase family protein [Candidatus Parcubacteria bacterium]|nr:peptidoglycan DD-metalloendopeptidase family protein [Candidatus Parcubacteria bacterium]
MIRRGLIILALIILPVFASAQTEAEKIAELREQIKVLEEQKQQLQGTIAQTAEQAATLKDQVQHLKNQINALQIQMQLTGKKIDQTSLEINGVEGNISETQKKINYQKDSISQLLLYLHKRDNENLVGLLLKSLNFSDYFNQQQYALTVNQKLVGLVNELQDNEQQLNDHKNDLESKKKSLESLKREQSVQKNSLASVQSDKDNLLKATKGQEAQYQKLLAQVEDQENQFFTQLRELETHVIQGGLYIVHVTAEPLPKKGTKMFEWPQSVKRITQGYGCTSYARCGSKRGAYGGAPHNGVDMASGFSTPIKAIADGKIIANGKNDGWGNWVAIQHPNQYNLVSVYAHMSALSFLQVGTEIHSGEVIGYEGNTGNAEGSHLHLSVYKDFFTYINEKKDQLYFNYFDGSINPLDYL